MRLALELINIKRRILSYYYPTSVREAILSIAQQKDPIMAQKLHDNDTEVFIFSQLLGRGKASEDGIRLLRGRLYISSTSPEFIKTLASTVILDPLFKIGEILFAVSNIRRLPELSSNNGNGVRLKTLSPIIVMNKTLDRYLYLNDPEFPDSLSYSIKHRFERTYGSPPKGDITVEPITETFHKKRIKIKNEFHNCSLGELIIKVPPEVIQFISDAGLGMKPKFGFGFMEVVK